MKIKQWIFGTLAAADSRGYHCIGKTEGLSNKKCSELERYCLSFGENNLKIDFSAYSIQYFDKSIAIIRHFPSNAIDHAGRQGGIIHHALIFDQTFGIDFSKFLIEDNFKTSELINNPQLSLIDINTLMMLDSFNKIDISQWYNLLKPMALKNSKCLSIIKNSQFSHCWCVAVSEENALLPGRILYNAFRLKSIKLSFCSNTLNPGTQTNLRIVTHPKVIEKVSAIIIKRNPEIKNTWNSNYKEVYKLLAKKETLFGKIKHLFT